VHLRIPPEHGTAKLLTMDEMHSALDRLEARLDHQAGRIDALYEMLELRGVLPRSAATLNGDGWFGADAEAHAEARDLCSVWKRTSPPARRRPTRIHVGDATGV
jgi:hypothetical protein